VGIAVIFIIFFFRAQRTEDPIALSGSDTDSVSPSTAIVSPEDRTWHNAGFSAAIRDSDIGAGLVSFLSGEQGCLYRIEDFGADKVFGNFRQCGKSDISISVGKDMACSSSYQKDSPQGRCRVSTKAIDQAGNESEWKSFLFFIDLEKPFIGPVSVEAGSLADTYVFGGQVADNGRIVSCRLFQDNQAVEGTVSFDSLPCQEDRICSISVQYISKDASAHDVRFGCQDAAGNVGYGEELSSLMFINQAPIIELCKVTPSQGNTSTIFQFESAARDLNQNILSFAWDFGDGTASQEQNITHSYASLGTYTPKLIVRDSRGKSDECTTAWVIVGEK